MNKKIILLPLFILALNLNGVEEQPNGTPKGKKVYSREFLKGFKELCTKTSNENLNSMKEARISKEDFDSQILPIIRRLDKPRHQVAISEYDQ